MKTTCVLTRLTLAAALMLTAVRSAPAQGLRQKGADPQQIWMKFEKELGLQQRYAADMEVQAMGMTMASTVYHDIGKTRTEMTVPFMNMKMVALQLTENGKMVGYTLFPDKKKYCVTPADEMASGDLDYTLKDVGGEVFEGVTCKKRRMTVKIPDQGTQVLDILFSPAQKNMPVKMTANAQIKTEQGAEPMNVNSVILFKNYRFGAQPAALFTIPKDYTKAKDMQEVMMGGGLFGGMQAPAAAGQAPGGQPQGMTLPPEALKALQEAQAEAEKEAAAGNNDEGAQALRQGLQSLRGLLGK